MNEEYYIHLLSTQLEGFKKSGSAYNFRCPLCGDSATKKNKKRGYLFRRDGLWIFKCHNCNVSQLFRWFLKNQNAQLYESYCFDIFKEKPVEEKKPKPVRVGGSWEEKFKKLTKISSLRPNHPSRDYIVSRQIPGKFHSQILHCSKFKTFTNYLIPGKFENLANEEPRILVPIWKHAKIIGYQGRSLDPNAKVRYITIALDEGQSLVWNHDEVMWNAKHYIFEGIFDAMMVPNSIAVLSSALVERAMELNKPKNYSVLCFDNEPRNKDIVASMKKAIKNGFRVFIPPVGFSPHKDMNSWVLGNLGVEPPFDYVHNDKVTRLGHELKLMIDLNTYYGLDAELKLAEWKKV